MFCKRVVHGRLSIILQIVSSIFSGFLGRLSSRKGGGSTVVSADGESGFGSAGKGSSSFGIGFNGAEEQKKSDLKGNGDESLA